MRSDIVPGAMFPDYERSDQTAKRRKLSELQGPHPMVLVLSRGGFCPKRPPPDGRLLELHRELDVAYFRAWAYRSKKDLDIAEYTESVKNPMIPAV